MRDWIQELKVFNVMNNPKFNMLAEFLSEYPEAKDWFDEDGVPK